jgi:hypothetical protein
MKDRNGDKFTSLGQFNGLMHQQAHSYRQQF